MKQVTDILAGLVFIIFDIIKATIIITKDMLVLFFTSNRKQNQFIALLAAENWVVDIIIFLGIFLIIGHYSLSLGVFITFISYFVVFIFKKDWWENNTNRAFRDGNHLFSTISSFLIIAITICYITINIPYKYERIGTLVIKNSDLNHSYINNQGEKKTIKHRFIEFNYMNNLEEINLFKCKEGKTTVYKETMQPFWFKIIKTDFVLGCSGEMMEYKNLEQEALVKVK